MALEQAQSGQAHGSCLLAPADCKVGAVDPDASLVGVQRSLIQEVLHDGCCPLHLRLELSRAFALRGAGVAPLECDNTVSSSALAPAPLLDGACMGLVAAFLPLEDLLGARAANADFLCSMMERVVDASVGGQDCTARGKDEARLRGECATATADHSEDALPADLQDDLLREDAATQRSTGQELEPEARVQPSVPVYCRIHDRLRARLWLRRLEDVTAGSRDERVFETRVRSFVDSAMRSRLEAEVTDAKARMENEVREAKLNMLQCVAAIQEEVDHRFREKVAILQQEFDHRSTEQARGLREMVERRVTEQTEALQAEVDRRTDCVRAVVERRAREQEEAAARLHEEVAKAKEALEDRVREQETAASRLNEELLGLRRCFLELAGVREAIEIRVAEQEAVTARLNCEITPEDSLSPAAPTTASPHQGAGAPRAARARPPPKKGVFTCCWAWLSPPAQRLSSAPVPGSSSRQEGGPCTSALDAHRQPGHAH